MTFLLEHLPPHVHVVLSTRADPDLPLARWRVRGELVEIRAADLRFTSDEADCVPQRGDRPGSRRGGHRGPGGANRGVDCRAAARRALDPGPRGRSGFIARFAGDDRYIVDYLVEEVLAHQPTRFADSCCTQRFSTGSPDRSVTPSPAVTTAAR